MFSPCFTYHLRGPAVAEQAAVRNAAAGAAALPACAWLITCLTFLVIVHCHFVALQALNELEFPEKL
jgi:hypothetical protein